MFMYKAFFWYCLGGVISSYTILYLIKRGDLKCSNYVNNY